MDRMKNKKSKPLVNFTMWEEIKTGELVILKFYGFKFFILETRELSHFKMKFKTRYSLNKYFNANYKFVCRVKLEKE